MNENEQFEGYRKIGKESIEHQPIIPDPDHHERTIGKDGRVEYYGKVIADVEWELENAQKKVKSALKDVTEEFPPETVGKYLPAVDEELKRINVEREQFALETKKAIEALMHSPLPTEK